MVTPELMSYIREATSRGMSREDVRKNLLLSNWTNSDVDEGFRTLDAGRPIEKNSTTPASVVMPAVSPTISEYTGPTISSISQSLPGATTYVPNQPKRTMSKGKFAILLILILLVLFGGGAAYSYFFYYNTPEKHLERAYLKVSDMRTFEYDLNMRATVLDADFLDMVQQYTESKNASVSVDMHGAFDTTDPEYKKSKTDITLNFGSTSFGAETRFIKDVVYGQITKGPSDGLFDLSDLMNHWYKADLTELEKLLADTEPEAAKAVAEYRKQNSVEKNTEALKEILQRKILVIENTLPAETIDGTVVNRYQFTLDKTVLREIVKEELETKRNAETNSLIDEALTEIDKEFEAITFSYGEMAIGKWDNNLYRVILTTDIADPETKKPVLQIETTLNLKNINQPVLIDAPANAESVLKSLDSARSKGTAAAIKDKLSNARANAELYYDSTYSSKTKSGSYAGFCRSTGSNGFSIIYEELVALDASPFCFDTAKDWMAYATLPAKKYFCVNSTGEAKEVEKQPYNVYCE